MSQKVKLKEIKYNLYGDVNFIMAFIGSVQTVVIEAGLPLPISAYVASVFLIALRCSLKNFYLKRVRKCCIFTLVVKSTLILKCLF